VETSLKPVVYHQHPQPRFGTCNHVSSSNSLILRPAMFFPTPLPAPRQVVPSLGDHPHAPLAPNLDAKGVGLAADRDFAPAVFPVAVGAPLLLGAGLAKVPSHDRSPWNEEQDMETGRGGTRSSSEAPLKERWSLAAETGGWMEPTSRGFHHIFSI
jgi:hypothetical protein